MNQSHKRLRDAIYYTSMHMPAKYMPKAMKLIIWELMKTQTKLSKLERKLMDKKLHKVTKTIEVAAKDVKKGKPKAAVKALKGAVKKNEKLVKEDRDIRDPAMKKLAKAKKAMC